MKAIGVSLIVKPIFKTKTDGGLEIPEEEYRNTSLVHKGKVISIGDGTYLNNKLDMNVEEGEIVFYRGVSGIEFKGDGEEYKILQISDILAKEDNSEAV